MKRLLLFCFLLLSMCSCSSPAGCTDAHSTNSCLRVLFIGNSYTSVNDLPATFAALARAGGHPIQTGMVCSGRLDTCAASQLDSDTGLRCNPRNGISLYCRNKARFLPWNRAVCRRCIRPPARWSKRSARPARNRSFSLPGHTGMAGRKTIYQIMKACSCKLTRVT